MPLVKAHPGQEAELKQLLSREPFYNLFLIANLNSGISPDLEYWVDGGAVLSRRRSNWVLDPGPRPDLFDFAAAAALIDSYAPEQVNGLVGRPEGVDPLYVALQSHQGKLYQQMYAGMPGEPLEITYHGTPRLATERDLDQLAAIYADAGDMSRNREAVARMLPTCWLVEDGGEIVSAGYMAGETHQAAMVAGIFTPPVSRGKGYATTLVHAMSRAVLAAGKRPCLFYHNPEAGRIYLRLGYRELGPWRMVRFH